MSTDHRKLRNQFNDLQRVKLIANLDFAAALAGEDSDKAMELAGRILIGEAGSLPESRKMKKMHDTFGDFLD
jgi:hypothetical protein